MTLFLLSLSLCVRDLWHSWSPQEQSEYRECDKNSTFGKLGSGYNLLSSFEQQLPIKFVICFCVRCMRTETYFDICYTLPLWNSNSFFQMISRTFLNNMKAFGLDNDICSEFLQKMSTIGELSEGEKDLEGLGRVAWNGGRPRFHANVTLNDCAAELVFLSIYICLFCVFVFTEQVVLLENSLAQASTDERSR